MSVGARTDPAPGMAAASNGWLTLAAVAAMLGAGASVYLLVEYVTGQPGICLTGSGCDEVRRSAFAYPLGIPMPALGVAFFGVAAWLVMKVAAGDRVLGVEPRVALLGLAAAGALAFAGLTAVEAFVIGAFCSWCLVAAAAGWLLLAAAVGARRVPEPGALPEEGRSRRVREQRARAVEAVRRRTNRSLWGSGAAMALLVGGLLVVGAIDAPAPVPGGGALAPATSPRLGNGAVTVVEFSDFQCPACASVSPVLQQLAAGDEISLVYRHFPLTSIHANATPAARAAAAAQRQDAFWPMAEALFARQSEWESLPAGEADAYFAALAGQLGLDGARWSADYASAGVRDQVAGDARAAADLQLRGTPTLYIDGRPYEGPITLEAMRAAIGARGG